MTRRSLKLWCAASVGALLLASWRAGSYYHRVVSGSQQQAVDLTLRGAAQLDGSLAAAMKTAKELADELSSRKLGREGFEARRKKALASLPFAAEIHLWPDAGEPAKRALASGKAEWVAPYYRKDGGALAVGYAAPVVRDGKPVGAVSISLSLDQIKAMVEGLDLGPSGFPELISTDGTYLYHPRNDFVLGRKTIFDLAKDFHDKDREQIGPRAVRGEGGLVDHVSTNTGLRSWFVYEPLKSSGWSLQNTFVRADLPYDIDRMRRLLFQLLLAFTACALLTTGMVLRVELRGRRDLWTLSTVSALVFTLGVALMWFLSLRLDARSQSAGAPVTDRATLAKLVDRYKQECARRHAEAPIFVPTGVFLEMARFVSAHSVEVTGYIWQRYDDKTTRGLDRGFTIRDAFDVTIGAPYREREENVEVIRWPFQATLHQNLSLAKYPLDQENLTFKLRHKDLDHNVVLTPDVASYKILAAKSKPGLDSELRIPGWRVLETFFSLQGRLDNTTFGLNRAVAKEDFPGMQFNVQLRRNLLDAFISNLSPIIIALILLFALQVVMTSDERLAAFMQMTSGRIVNICVSMFFVIVFAHISVRRGMNAEEIFYVEYFYFVTYLMILWVAINSIVFVKMKNVRWLQYEENLVPKLLFWPVVTGFLFAASVATFY